MTRLPCLCRMGFAEIGERQRRWVIILPGEPNKFAENASPEEGLLHFSRLVVARSHRLVPDEAANLHHVGAATALDECLGKGSIVAGMRFCGLVRVFTFVGEQIHSRLAWRGLRYRVALKSRSF